MYARNQPLYEPDYWASPWGSGWGDQRNAGWMDGDGNWTAGGYARPGEGQGYGSTGDPNPDYGTEYEIPKGGGNGGVPDDQIVRQTDPRNFDNYYTDGGGGSGYNGAVPNNAQYGWTQGTGNGRGFNSDYSSNSTGSAPRIGRWDENFNLQDNAAMQATLRNLSANILPELQSTMASQGLARSGAAVDATGRAISGAMVPVTQAIMNAEVQNKGQDVNQRSTDISAALQQSSQGLQARGQDLDAQRAALAGFTGISNADTQRLLSAINADSELGGKERSIEDARYGAQFAELMRQFGIAHDNQYTPFTGATNMIGNETRTRGK